MPRAVGRCGPGGSAVFEPLGRRVTARTGVRSGQQGPLRDQGTEARRSAARSGHRSTASVRRRSRESRGLGRRARRRRGPRTVAPRGRRPPGRREERGWRAPGSTAARSAGPGLPVRPWPGGVPRRRGRRPWRTDRATWWPTPAFLVAVRGLRVVPAKYAVLTSCCRGGASVTSTRMCAPRAARRGACASPASTPGARESGTTCVPRSRRRAAVLEPNRPEAPATTTFMRSPLPGRDGRPDGRTC